MPKSAPTPCRYPGCAQVLSTHGYCAQHQTKVHRDYSRARKGFDTELGFYRSARWRNTCAAVLRGNPVYCVLQLAKVVDHIVPIKLGGERFERSNLRGLCVPCLNAKTASETATSRQ